jgi:hypothetical protein
VAGKPLPREVGVELMTLSEAFYSSEFLFAVVSLQIKDIVFSVFSVPQA